MSGSDIAKAGDFKAAIERANIERVVLPGSGLPVLLCRPPVFAALATGRAGTQLQTKVTDAKPEEVRTEDIEAFTEWLTETLTRLFVEPRFASAPGADEIGLADILIEDLKFIFRWLRGEVFVSRDAGLGVRDSGVTSNPETRNPNPESVEDLGRFSGGQGTGSIPGGSREAKLLPSERTPGTHGHAGLSAGLHRG
jgi:hypothetical protein